MDVLNVLRYGGIAVLVTLLIVFELKDGRFGKRRPLPLIEGYDYYTVKGYRVRIHKAFGSLYKVYVYNNCPVSTKKDRSGDYIPIRARSASEVEHIVDAIYQQDEDVSDHTTNSE